MDYAFRLMDIPLIFYTVSTALFIGVWLGSKKWDLGLLSGYLFFIVAVTLISRTPFEGWHFQPQLFWSYQYPVLRQEILFNIIAFVPVGLLAGKRWGWKGILLGTGTSCCIEVVQLVAKLGLFELDDIFHNTLGTVIGVALAMLIKRMVKVRRRERARQTDDE